MDSRQQAIFDEFSAYTDWEAKYTHLMKLGKALEPMPEAFKTDDNTVKGCQSTVWMHAELQADGLIRFYGDSDALIVKGLVALLLRVYSGLQPTEVLTTEPDVLHALELSKHLSMTRNNGLAAMLKQMKLYAMAFKVQQEAGL